jgi:hypothetical protein
MMILLLLQQACLIDGNERIASVTLSSAKHGFLLFERFVLDHC